MASPVRYPSSLRNPFALLFCLFVTACGGGSDAGAGAPSASSADQTPQANGASQAPATAADPTRLPDKVTGETASTAAAPAPVPQPGQSTEPPWSIVDLGAALGPDSKPAAMNDAGDIVGATAGAAADPSKPPIQNPFLLKQGKLTDLGNLGGAYGGANDINGAGQIAGYSYVASLGQTHAFLYENGAMKDIGMFIGSGGSWAKAINRLGQVAIYTDHGTYLYQDGAVKAVPGDMFLPAAINDQGQIAGTQLPAGPRPEHAMLYDGATLVDLGTPAGKAYSIATAMNNAGQVVGVGYNVGAEDFRAFLYDGTMHEIGAADSVESSATSINDGGDVVGWMTGADGQSRAFLYRDGRVTDLNTLPGVAGSGWALSTALRINNAGQILAAGSINGRPGYALLAPPH